MADNKITTTIKCHNIAPLENLEKEFSCSSLKTAIFANNGSGKTFISRLFRLTEQSEELVIDEDGNSPTDKLLTFGKSNGSFSFMIADKKNAIVESFNIDISKKTIPAVFNTNFIYHTFNQDYVDDNIRALSFEKNSDIEGFILGKVNIDLKDDEDRLVNIEKEGKLLTAQIANEIQKYVAENIDNITNIKRLNEYKSLNFEHLISHIENGKINNIKPLVDLLDDYNKIKSVPDNLQDIEEMQRFVVDFDLLKDIKDCCFKEYSLSSFSDEFKQCIKQKEDFIEKGVNLLDNQKSVCPFCGQALHKDALSLIDHYTKYLMDTEARIIRALKVMEQKLETIIKALKDAESKSNKIINQFNNYKEKYIPSCKDVGLEGINTEKFQVFLREIIELIYTKTQSINVSIELPELVEYVTSYLLLLNQVIDSNNDKIKSINNKKNRIADENKNVRREILKAAYNLLFEENIVGMNKIVKLRNNWKELQAEIKRKSEQQKTRRKDRVASTIKKILNYFFLDKYTLDEETFRLIFRTNVLGKNQAKEVLSEGEKNIIAFAYFLGDVHLKINSENDYQKLFFIIDDPISSMDFTHVYTLCGVIRDIKQIINGVTQECFIILTHNVDFMRVSSSNKIVDKKMLLKKGELKDYNTNSTVPYIDHLMDIYKIARCGESPTHTTANSIRHIIETLTKFENIEVSSDSIAEYIRTNIPDDTKSYTLINDLSHGAWRGDSLL